MIVSSEREGVECPKPNNDSKKFNPFTPKGSPFDE